MLKGAIRQLFQDYCTIDRVRASETKSVLVVRLERFQRGLTQEDVDTITEGFKDRGYVWYEVPRARVVGELLASASRVHANSEISVNNGEPADAVMSGIVADEELNMQDSQHQTSAQNAGFCVIFSDDDTPAPGIGHPPPDDERHVQVCLACYGRSLDAHNEEHLQNIELKARNDQAQAQIDELRRQNSTLEGRHTLHGALKRVLHDSRREYFFFLMKVGLALDDPSNDGDKLRRIECLFTRYKEEDKARRETYMRGRL
ncbi:hypothetical protein BOTNAR_0024g00330 [Botryotinia narcissicola]|uniref:Uncharacterized protein n=1 Tax=Botryotinia narcissicola TaxID=278944 RepID=A0A4Z1JAI2_9HELO|nr:hypothetical protein BOTNAR_0024g00330 [Botryotinia narcissicola]